MWRRWAGGTVEGESIVLNRIIDDAYFDDVEREGDPARRLLLVLDLVGRRAFNSSAFDERIEQYYPRLGSLRDDLLAIAQSKAFAVADDDYGESPAQRAKNLLIYWFDPRDESRIGSGERGCVQALSSGYRKHRRFTREATARMPKHTLLASRKRSTTSPMPRSAPTAKHATSSSSCGTRTGDTGNRSCWLDDGGRWNIKLVGEGAGGMACRPTGRRWFIHRGGSRLSRRLGTGQKCRAL